MRIFCTSDIHGRKDLFDKLKSATNHVDAFLYCGDLGGYGHESHSIASLTSAQERDAAYFYGILDSMAIDTHFILGNDDWFESDDRRHLLQPAMLGEYPLIPFEWVSTTPFLTNREAHDNKLTYELSKIHADSNTIVLAHTPPFGVGDLLYNGQHCGSRAVRRWIETTQPKLWLCGHIHENHCAGYIGQTLVLNCACTSFESTLKGWIVDTETMEFEDVSVP